MNKQLEEVLKQTRKNLEEMGIFAKDEKKQRYLEACKKKEEKEKAKI